LRTVQELPESVHKELIVHEHVCEIAAS